MHMPRVVFPGIVIFGLVLALLGTGPVPARAQWVPTQQQAQYTPTPENVVHVQCKRQDNLWQMLALNGILWGGLGAMRGDPNIQSLGSVATSAGRLGYEKEVAREGRAQVNVYQGQSQPPVTTRYVFDSECSSRAKRFSFAANSYQDFDRNNASGLNEFIGVKDRFRDDENVMLVIYNVQKKGSVRVDLYDPQGNWIQGTALNAKKKNWVLSHYVDMHRIRARKNYGIYTAVWSAKGLSSTTTFEIVPSSQSQ